MLVCLTKSNKKNIKSIMACHKIRFILHFDIKTSQEIIMFNNFFIYLHSSAQGFYVPAPT